MKTLWNREPILILAAIEAGIALLSSFGFELTGKQVGAIMTFSAAVLALIARGQVTPAAGGSTSSAKDFSMPGFAFALPLGLALALASGACASSGATVALQAEKAIYTAAAAAQDGADAAKAAGLMTPAQHQTFNQKLVPALEAGRDFNRAVREESLTGVAKGVQALAALSLAVNEYLPANVREPVREAIAKAAAQVAKVLGAASGAGGAGQ
jgi:hypothetical protein